MNSEVKSLKEKAEKARLLYMRNLISRDEARNEIMPYINAVNERSNELAKKYKVKPRFVFFNSFIR